MKQPRKIVTTLVGITVLTLLFFSSNIYGYFRFQSYCSNEGGLHAYKKLEKNVGWWTKDKYQARDASLIRNVEFVRYSDKNRKSYDLKYIGGSPTLNDSYSIMVSDLSKPLMYEWKNTSELVNYNDRLKKFSYEIINLADKEIVAGYYVFYYSPFGGALGGPDWRTCANQSARFDGWVEAFNNIFD